MTAEQSSTTQNAYLTGNHEPPQVVSLSPLLLSNHEPPQFAPLLLASHQPPHLTAPLLRSHDPAPLSPLLLSNHQPLPDPGASRIVPRVVKAGGYLTGESRPPGGLCVKVKGACPGPGEQDEDEDEDEEE